MTNEKSDLRKKVDALTEALDAFGDLSTLTMIHLECEVDDLREFGEVQNERHQYLAPSVTIVRGKEQVITLFAKWKAEQP